MTAADVTHSRQHLLPLLFTYPAVPSSAIAGCCLAFFSGVIDSSRIYGNAQQVILIFSFLKSNQRNEKAEKRQFVVDVGVTGGRRADGANHLYSAIADMAQALNVREGAVQSVMAAYLLTYGVSQLFYGPLSDRVGRRP